MAGRVGVLGAYGGLGSQAARELARTGVPLRLGGRDPGRLDALAAELPGAEARALDVSDRASVLDFCAGCEVILNGSRYSDGLAEALLEAGRHVVDATAFRSDRWLDRSGEVAARGATWIVHTGWLPGLPEVVGAYAEALAVERLGSAEVEIYAYDRNAYQGVGLSELVSAFFRRPGVLDLWAWMRGRPSPPPPADEIQVPMGATRMVTLPAPVGWTLASQMQMGGRHPVFVAFDPGLMPAMMQAMWYGRTRSAAWMAEEVVGPATRRRVEQAGPAEIVRARATGPGGQTLHVDFVETSRPGYWLSGVVPATAARLLAEGRVTTRGITTLDQAIAPQAVVEALAQAGLTFTVQG